MTRLVAALFLMMAALPVAAEDISCTLSRACVAGEGCGQPDARGFTVAGWDGASPAINVGGDTLPASVSRQGGAIVASAGGAEARVEANGMLLFRRITTRDGARTVTDYTGRCDR
ncbi:hypothetical protein [Tropicimonas sp. IMCC34011]|uniref:hypothetical protein n=1 Tax=Tropicimonas sp. IMCC34011 TaxID=2248759 RepID=UPI000E240CE8|nr:hypothetical protein [Tropicimonas sp. IMCC34011]